jgi:uncharacterized protein YbaR (Trm112 family)
VNLEEEHEAKGEIPLVCPTCRFNGDISHLGDLKRLSRAHDESLACNNCGEIFPVESGIPVLVPERHRAKSNFKQDQIDSEYIQFNTRATKRVAQLIRKHSHGQSLDVGCGKGAYSEYFNGTVVLSDVNYYFVSEALRTYPGRYAAYGLVADARYLPFPPDSFDFIIGSNVIEHLPREDTQRTIYALQQTTRDILQIDVPNSSGLISLLTHCISRLGFYKSEVPQDESLDHHSFLVVSDLRNTGFRVRGCISWVSRKEIRIGFIWSLYDLLTWRLPWMAGTIIGIYKRNNG